MNYIVYGLGVSGISTAKYLIKNNYKVIVTDDNDSAIEASRNKLAAEISQHQENIKFLKSSEIASECAADTIVVFAPGIPLYHPKPHKIIEIVKKSGAKLLCDIELFYLLNSAGKTFLGITGTNGKSTTTALTGFIFDELKIDAQIGGNIGVPCFELSNVQNYVFEISSYHLDLMEKTHFKTAVLTNITPDHIDRHGSFENYIAVKKKIFLNQGEKDYAIIGVDNEYSKNIFTELKSDTGFKAALVSVSTQKVCDGGVAVINGYLYNKIDGAMSDISLEGIILKGEHNMQNVAMAFASVYCTLYKVLDSKELEQKIIAAIKKFKGLRHRMQLLGNIDGINFINDSKATNAESTENALKSYENIFWILGGKAKDGGISSLQPYFAKITKAYLIGEASDQFAEVLQKNNVEFEKCFDLKNAFNRAFLDAKKSSLKERNILLSPACASFDQWKNFEERGDYFCTAFDEIKKI